MKVLILHSIQDSPKRHSAVDLWRIYRPWHELKKHVDWQIDESATAIKELEKYKKNKDFTPAEMEKSAKWLGQYDIIHASYFTNAAQFALLMTVQKIYGTKFILDVDDDMFSINPDNPFWLKCTHEDVYNMQQMIKHVDWITTTTERLAHELRKRRSQKADTVMVLPNYLPDVYKESEPDNGDKIVIGYFGGASHYRDLHETGCVEGIAAVMHKHKNVLFKSVGMPLDKYVPRQRYEFIEGQRGTQWAEKLYPKLHFDISIGPLEDTVFARGKSNIKWLESTRMGAAFVASNIGPYQRLKHGECGLLIKNDIESWEYALDELVTDVEKRKRLVKNSKDQLKKNWRLEDNWQSLKNVIERVNREVGSSNSDQPSRKILTVS